MINKSTSCDGSDLLLINFKEVAFANDLPPSPDNKC